MAPYSILSAAASLQGAAGCSRKVEPRKFHVGASTHIPGLFATQSSPYTYACTGTCILGIVMRRHSPWLDVRASTLIRDPSLRVSPVRERVELANRSIKGFDSLGNGSIEGTNAKGKVPWK